MAKLERYMSTVKVGPKGQIVIPKEVREMFGIEPGDMLMVLADAARGIAIQRADIFNNIANQVFEGKGKELYPEEPEENVQTFAREVKKTIANPPDED